MPPRLRSSSRAGHSSGSGRSSPHRVAIPTSSRRISIPARSTTIRADRAGIASRVDNRQLSDLARRAGAPRDSGAGLVVHRTVGDEVEAGDRLYTIHAETRAKLEEAMSFADQLEPIRVRSKADALVERR